MNESIAAASEPRRPTPAHEYMLYQSLLGAWPLAGPDEEFIERMQAYLIKAAREGKEQTSWISPEESYEAALTDFARRILSGEPKAFVESFGAFARRAAMIGALKSLTQVTLKIMMPGVPDFYQGTELWDLSLVDPDSRRPVDFARRRADLRLVDRPDWQALAANWPGGRIKLALTHRLLALRHQNRELFTDGSYLPLEATGPHGEEVVAFARIKGREAVIVAAGRLFGRASEGGRKWPDGSPWKAILPLQHFTEVRDSLGLQADACNGNITTFGALPIAVLHAQYTGRRQLARSAKKLQTQPA